jgi:hypothetical protein
MFGAAMTLAGKKASASAVALSKHWGKRRRLMVGIP